MKPETRLYLDKSRKSLSHARAILNIELGEDAARAAYISALHAAQALIFERTGRVAKTHRGVHGEFIRLISNQPAIDADLRRFLSEGYKLKTVADYDVGPDASVPLDEAAAAIDTTARLVDAIAELLDQPAP